MPLGRDRAETFGFAASEPSGAWGHPLFSDGSPCEGEKSLWYSATSIVDNPSNLDWGISPDWSAIPSPTDDGGVGHLQGADWPPISLPATDGLSYDLSLLQGRTVIYAYPRTGQPGIPNPDGWDLIPGARGCTPQSCSFRDHFSELKACGVAHLFGLSTQSSDYQREAVARLHLPFPLLSDEHLTLTQALNLPTFEAGGMRLLKRCTFILNEGRIEHVFYPVFPPDESASAVLRWLLDQHRNP